MAWRTVVIENPAKLSLKDNKLVIDNDAGVCALPIEDIDVLLVDSYGITLTSNLLAELAVSGVAAIICDSKHLPSAITLPFSQHSRQAKISREQLAMKEPFRKQLWQKNIEQKITNQAEVLDFFNSVAAERLKEMSKRVRSGDVENLEAQAARIYFAELLEDVTRRQPTWYNSALDYGYALVRSCIARSVAAHGLVASQGIFHHSELNSFNLVDDLIECFRPFVDLFVLREMPEPSEPLGSLTKEDKHAMLDVLEKNAIIEGRKYPVRHAADITVESFVAAILNGSITYLKLPSITLD